MATRPTLIRGAKGRPTAAGTVLAPGAARGTRLAFPLDRAPALVAGIAKAPPPLVANDVTITVLTPNGLDFQNHNALTEMGSGAVQ